MFLHKWLNVGEVIIRTNKLPLALVGSIHVICSGGVSKITLFWLTNSIFFPVMFDSLGFKLGFQYKWCALTSPIIIFGSSISSAQYSRISLLVLSN